MWGRRNLGQQPDCGRHDAIAAKDQTPGLSGAARAGREEAAGLTVVHELVRTNNAVLITAIEALLKGAEIPHMVLDQHMSVLEGSLGMLPRRIVVDTDYVGRARRLLTDAGLAHALRPDGG